MCLILILLGQVRSNIADLLAQLFGMLIDITLGVQEIGTKDTSIKHLGTL